MRSVAEGLLACHCGKAGVRQDWGLVMKAVGGVKAAYERCDLTICCGTMCQAAPWHVMPGVPFQLTEWRRDLVACNCGAEGRLIQDWNAIPPIAQLIFPTEERCFPAWMEQTCSHKDTMIKYVLWTVDTCRGCLELTGHRFWPWYAVPGVDLLAGPESGLVVPYGTREPLVRRYCPVDD